MELFTSSPNKVGFRSSVSGQNLKSFWVQDLGFWVRDLGFWVRDLDCVLNGSLTQPPDPRVYIPEYSQQIECGGGHQEGGGHHGEGERRGGVPGADAHVPEAGGRDPEGQRCHPRP